MNERFNKNSGVDWLLVVYHYLDWVDWNIRVPKQVKNFQYLLTGGLHWTLLHLFVSLWKSDFTTIC